MFLNPWLLAFATAGAVPIIIHLLAKRRFTRVPWAAMRWLLESLERNRRRVQIEELVLLLIRVALLVLLAFAVAHPLLSSSGLYDTVIWLFFTIPLALAIWAATELRAPARYRWIGRSAAGIIGAFSLVWLLGAGANEDGENSFGGWSLSQRMHRVIVLDRSMSMSQKVNGHSAFGEAQKTAAWLVSPESGLRNGDTVTLLLADNETQAEINAATDLGVVRQAIQGLSAGDGGTDLPRALEEAYTVLSRSEQPRREVFVITDMTSEAWLRDQQLKSSDFRKIADTFEEGREPALVLIDVGKSDAGTNLAITSIEAEPRIIAANSRIKFTIKVRNHGRKNVQGVKLELQARRVEATGMAEGEILGRTQLDVDAGNRTAEVGFEHTFTEPGPIVVTATLGDDRLPPDNKRHLALNVVDNVPVLLVDGEPSVDWLGGETSLLELALAPEDDAQQEFGLFAPHVIDELELPDADFAPYAMVVLANVANVPREKRAALRRYVREGGALMVFMGERVDAVAWNEAFTNLEEPETEEEPLLPAVLGDTRGTSAATADQTAFALAAGPYQHPALEQLKSLELHNLRIRKHMLCTVHADDEDARVVLSFADGQPAIVERKYGRGRVMLVTTTADKDWSSLPARTLFLPLVQELTSWMVEGASASRNATVSERLSLPLQAVEAGAELRLHPPDRNEPARTVAPSEDGTLFRSEPIERAGAYWLDINGRTHRRVAFAVNHPRPESDLERLEKPLVRKFLQLPADYAEGLQQLKTLMLQQAADRDLWPPLIWTVLGLLLVETLLGQLFGRRSVEERRD